MRGRMIAACFAAMAIAAAAAAARKTPGYVWRNVAVGGGGFAPDIVFSRAERGLAYLRTDMGGVYRWSAKRREWIPLEDAIAQSSYFGIESIAADPVDPNVVYVAAGMYAREPAAILRSEDRGNTWRIFPTPFHMGGNAPGRGVGERLAIDPSDRSTLYFGSRYAGLQRSTDRGETWSRVNSFPIHGVGWRAASRDETGISFVVIDPADVAKRQRSRRIFVGVTDPGPQHLYRSDDGGVSWTAVPHQPHATLLPVHAQLDSQGVLYVTYSNGVGPNGVTAGAIFRYDTRSGQWTNITPERGAHRAPGGYMGLSVDAERPGTLVVATLNRWHPGDILWRTTDGGRTWRNLRTLSRRDVAATPFLLWGNPQADFGWWMAGVAIDPFDSEQVAYTTGATVYATHELLDADQARNITWKPWVQGVEQTAVITLASPSKGPHLLSGLGDISGFAHEDLSRSPREQFTHPSSPTPTRSTTPARIPASWFEVGRHRVRPHREPGLERQHWRIRWTTVDHGNRCGRRARRPRSRFPRTDAHSWSRRPRLWLLSIGADPGRRCGGFRVGRIRSRTVWRRKRSMHSIFARRRFT